MVDYDNPKGQTPLTPTQVIDKICDVFPEFRNGAKVINYSASSCIYEGDQELPGGGTYRQGGKVKGKSSRIMTISYWDFINQWIEGQSGGYTDNGFYIPEEKVDSALLNLSEAIGIKGNPKVLQQQLEEKLRPWQAKAIEQYKNSEEYGHVQKYVEAWKECVRLRQESFFKKQEEQKRQEEKEKCQREAEEEFARERSRQYNERMGQGGRSLNFSENEDQMFKRVWKAGYRALSIQFHPDKGGDGEQMKMLNGLKDKLGSMVK